MRTALRAGFCEAKVLFFQGRQPYLFLCLILYKALKILAIDLQNCYNVDRVIYIIGINYDFVPLKHGCIKCKIIYERRRENEIV